MSVRTSAEKAAAARAVVDAWRLLVHLDIYIREQEDHQAASRATQGSLFTVDRALIMFLCGGEAGQRDKRDIRPSDFLGHDWFPGDEEMDQRLRGRLRIMSKTQAHLTWWSVQDETMVIWPYDLLVQETSWAMGQFVDELRRAQGDHLRVFEDAKDELGPLIPTERSRVSTSEYGPPRPGQVDRR